MSEGRPRRRDGITLEAVDPPGGKCRVQVAYERMQVVGRRSLGHAQECGHLVPMVLQHPTAVFEGLCRDDDEDRRGVGWRCYCGVPDRAYYADGAMRPPYPGQVYLVFVNDERVAYNWRWERCDPDDATLPENHAARFKRRLL